MRTALTRAVEEYADDLGIEVNTESSLPCLKIPLSIGTFYIYIDEENRHLRFWRGDGMDQCYFAPGTEKKVIVQFIRRYIVGLAKLTAIKSQSRLPL